MKRFLLLLSVFSLFISCGTDDDVTVGNDGNATSDTSVLFPDFQFIEIGSGGTLINSREALFIANTQNFNFAELSDNAGGFSDRFLLYDEYYLTFDFVEDGEDLPVFVRKQFEGAGATYTLPYLDNQASSFVMVNNRQIVSPVVRDDNFSIDLNVFNYITGETSIIESTLDFSTTGGTQFRVFNDDYLVIFNQTDDVKTLVRFYDLNSLTEIGSIIIDDFIDTSSNGPFIQEFVGNKLFVTGAGITNTLYEFNVGNATYVGKRSYNIFENENSVQANGRIYLATRNTSNELFFDLSTINISNGNMSSLDIRDLILDRATDNGYFTSRPYKVTYSDEQNVWILAVLNFTNSNLDQADIEFLKITNDGEIVGATETPDDGETRPIFNLSAI